MLAFILAMYVAMANGVYVPAAVQVVAWAAISIQFTTAFLKNS